MPERLSYIDLAILVGYLAVTVGLGCWFAFRRTTTSSFLTGGRSLPGWAVGLSMFGSYVSSISFLANPGKSFASNWNAFVFSLATPIAAFIAVRWFVPFYRRNGNVSAYEHLERRFGPWARMYAVICFLLTQMARTGTILYLLALAVAPLIGWDVRLIILFTGSMMILYSISGGIESAVWIGVLQSIVLLVGPLICLIVLLNMIPGGISTVITEGAAEDKFSLGSMNLIFSEPTFWVVLLMGLTMNLSNFSVDQSYVQRYITTPTEKYAKRSVWITTMLYVPVAAFFFLIGTALFVLHTKCPDLFAGIDANAPDTVFPFFISQVLPVGMSGLVVAAIFAASMDSTLSSMATLTLCDIFKRAPNLSSSLVNDHSPRSTPRTRNKSDWFFSLRVLGALRGEPGVAETSSEGISLFILRISTLLWGGLAIGVALAMTKRRNALDVWWEMAGIFSGGMLGLFLLGFLSRIANPAAITAVSIGIASILWMTISRWPIWDSWLAALPVSSFHAFMIPVVGTLVVLLVGLVANALWRKIPGTNRLPPR